MFGWFYEFLFMISKTLFKLIDGLIMCANKLCGIDPINFNGKESDFLTYLMFSDEIGFAFRISAVLATMLLALFTVFMIIRSVVKDKAEGTPAQIAAKSFKTLITFFLVPLSILAFMTIGNAFVRALYSATIQASATPGSFLFSVFAKEGGMPAEAIEQFRTGALDYYDTDVVSRYMDISEFPFIFSWLAGGIVLFGIGSAMLIFVDRAISLVILYIASPISISTSVLDDGARFKLWRDQFLSKFIMGYGMILAINIYALICGLVMDSGFTFFKDSDFLNLLMKLLVIGGGGLTMQKSMALVGNLVSQGAGSNELRDNAFTAGRLARMASGAAGTALAWSPVGLAGRAGASIFKDALAMKSRDLGAWALGKVGMGLSGGTSDEKGVKDPQKSSGADNNEKADYNGDKDKAKNAIDPGFAVGNWNHEGNSNNNNANKNDNLVSNAIQNNDNNKNQNNGGGEQK